MGIAPGLSSGLRSAPLGARPIYMVLSPPEKTGLPTVEWVEQADRLERTVYALAPSGPQCVADWLVRVSWRKAKPDLAASHLKLSQRRRWPTRPRLWLSSEAPRQLSDARALRWPRPTTQTPGCGWEASSCDFGQTCVGWRRVSGPRLAGGLPHEPNRQPANFASPATEVAVQCRGPENIPIAPRTVDEDHRS